jgi:hypothetical protein
MKFKLLFSLLLGIFSWGFVYGQQDIGWTYPSYSMPLDTYGSDSSFYQDANGHQQSVWRVLKGGEVFDYYADGNLQAISKLKLTETSSVTDTDGTERTMKVFEYNGLCRVFYDDSLRKLAAVGMLKKGHSTGDWKYYDHFGRLSSIWFAGKEYVVKEIDYSGGKAVQTVEKKFLAFYLNNIVLLAIIIFGSFFSRVFINSKIYNRENGTRLSPIYFSFPGYISKNFGHSLLCTFTLWFFNYSPKNRRLAIISNLLSLIALSTFFGILIGLCVSGALN